MGYDHIRSILGTRVEVWAVKRLARRAALVIQDRFHGPIPARAGQPALRQGAHGCDGAYPRSRGATWGLRVPPTFWPGLSPLARGNLGQANLGATNYGPIPARAGQPSFADWSEARRWAYPRSRGATPTDRLQYVRTEGLSPLARGNLLDSQELFDRVGPIPARAGQPPAAFL